MGDQIMTKAKPKITIHNVETGEIIERDMTADEILEAETKAETDALLKTEADAKETAKAALLDRLGITTEEAALLLS